jgi:alpha-L-rhamnosidase
VPARAPGRATADSRYALWVNGHEISRGPVRDNPRRLHYDTFDLAPVLRVGRNALAVLVRFYRDPTPWWMPAVPTMALGAGSLLVEVQLAPDVQPGVDASWVVSDRSWRALRSDAWREIPRRGIGAAPIEVVDARRLPARWREVGFDDSGWSEAVELGAHFVGTSGVAEPPSHPFGALRARAIPQLGGELRSARVVAVRPRAGRSGPADEALEDPVYQAERDLESARRDHPPASSPEGIALPLTLAPGRGASVVSLDFGEEVAGQVVLEVEAAAGTRFDLACGEGFRSDGSLDRLQQHSGFRYVARGGGAESWETLDAIGLRTALLSVADAAAPVVLRALRVQERLCPGAPGPAFSCSDPLLERIWRAGRRTVDLCSHDAYLDCPSREQRAWTGDSVVHLMVDLATNADWRLARHHLELAASLRPDGMFPMAVACDMEHADQTFIPDWPLHWLHGLHEIWRHTADRELVARLLAPAECLLRWFVPFQGPDGLLAHVTGWVLIDWSAVGTAGVSAALNALWARALGEFAALAEAVGDAGRAAWARGVRERVQAGFELFWDEARGVYVDHVLDGVVRRPVSQHANAAAICAGLVPAERTGRVLSAILDRARLVRASWILPGASEPPADGDMYAGAATLVTGPPEPWWDVERQVVAAQPFFRYVVHDAVAAAGRSDLVADLCRDWGELLVRCPTTLSESWFGGSRCHGWSATPTRDLIVRTLGIEPLEPGYAVARVAPRLGDLAWARGAAPTPRGWLEVAVSRESIEIASPVPVALELPGRPPALLAAGRHRVARE